MSRKYVLILIGVMFLFLVAACDDVAAVIPAGLPEGAKQELDFRLKHYDGAIGYTIVSAVRGSNPTGFSAHDDADEVWCVVVALPAGAEPATPDHLRLWREALAWTSFDAFVENDFLELGCNNW